MAVLEVSIGLGLITGWLLRTTLAVFFVHMAGVFATLVVVPDVVWAHGSPLLPTMERQYIIKNIVLVTACLAVATRRGSKDVSPVAVHATVAAHGVLSGAGSARQGSPPAA